MSNSAFIVILAFYTLFILSGIYYYEDKLTKLNRELDILDSDYGEVYGAVLEANNDMFDKIYELDKDNKLLQNQIKSLKVKNSELRATAGDWQRAYNLRQPIQYNYTSWQPDNYNYAGDPSKYQLLLEDTYIQDTLDLDQWYNDNLWINNVAKISIGGRYKILRWYVHTAIKQMMRSVTIATMMDYILIILIISVYPYASLI